MHGFWPSSADAPAASQKCWAGVETQQSCHCKLEKENKYRGFICHWGGPVTSPWLCRGRLTALLASHRATRSSACGWPEILNSICFEKKEKLGLPRGKVSWWCWFRIAVTRLLPGLANSVTPLFRETSEAYNIRGKGKMDKPTISSTPVNKKVSHLYFCDFHEWPMMLIERQSLLNLHNQK